MNNAIIVTLMTVVITVPLFFDTSMFSCFDLSKITVLYGLVFIASGIWCVKVIRYSETPSIFKLPPLGFPVLAMLIATGMATIFSVSPYMSLVGTHKRYGGLISAIVYALLFFLITRFVRRRHVESFINIIIVTAVVAAVFGLFQSFNGNNQYNTVFSWSTDFGFGGRLASTFGSPAFFSTFLVMAVPLVLYRMLDGCGKKTVLFLYLPILAVLLFAFYETKTRASFVGLVVALCFFCYMARSQVFSVKRLKIIAVVVVLGITACCFSINDKNSLLNRFLDESKGGKITGGALNRLIQYKIALKITGDYPAFGIGPDVLGMIYPRYYTNTSFRGFLNQDRIHNDTLDIAVSTGLVGLSAFCWLAFAYGYMVWRRLRTHDENRMLLVGLVSGVIVYVVQNQFSFGHVPIIMLFWVLLGLSVVVCDDKGIGHSP